MVAIAGGRVVAHAVDVVVGEGDALRGIGAEDDVLTADASGLYRVSILDAQYRTSEADIQ